MIMHLKKKKEKKKEHNTKVSREKRAYGRFNRV